MRVRPSSKTRPVKLRRLGIESLGTRIVLSAGGLGGPLADMVPLGHAGHGHDGLELGLPDWEKSAEFRGPMAERSIASPWGATLAGDGRGTIAAPFSADTTWSMRGADSKATLGGGVLLVGPTFGSNLLLTPSVVMPSMVVIVVTTPSFANYVQTSNPAANPLAMEHDTLGVKYDWQPNLPPNYPRGAILGNGGNAPVINSIVERAPSTAPPANDLRATASSGSDTGKFFGWVNGLAQAVNTPASVADTRSGSSWSPTLRSNESVPYVAPQPKTSIAPSPWESAETDAEGGFIELESPTSPRRKGRLKSSDLAERADVDDQNAARLERLMQDVWSGWGKVWDALGEIAHSQRQQEKPRLSDVEQTARSIDAGLVDGMIELAVEGPAPVLASNAYVADVPDEEGGKVRMDAGVTLYQEFELATAPDAAPPVTARATEPAAASAQSPDIKPADERAESKTDAGERPTSAAILGAGIVGALPISLRRLRRDEDECERPLRLRVQR